MKVRKVLSNFLDGKNIFFTACMLIIAICIFTGRNVSISQIWKGYRVLYVPESVSEDSVLAVLSDVGCSGVITLSAQRIPLSTKFFNSLLGSSSYLEDRLGYFRDADGDYRLFYIPDTYEKESGEAVNRLVRDLHLNAGLDTKESYPFMVPIIVLALYIFLCVLSLKRFYFALPGFFSLLLVFSQPFYCVACGCCFFLFALFLANRVWGRKAAVASVFKNFYIDVLLVISLMFSLAQSWRCFVFSLLVIAASACAILFLLELKIIQDRNSSFTYSLIFTARQIPILYMKTARYLLCLLIPLFAFLLLFIFSAKFSSSTSASGIRMPSPIQLSTAEPSVSEAAYPLNSMVLPNAEDYFKWAWGVISYPYKTLNAFSNVSHSSSASVQDGDKIILPRYEENDKGIKRKDELVLTYNNAFRRDMEKTVAGFEYPAIEKLLNAQDRDVLVMYSAVAQGHGKRSDFFNLFSIIFSLLVPVILCTIFYSFNRSRV